ncbi:hypothetical protein [Staphylococcus aureus]|uniref:hypothetical protein n=1 Tax=Staphylococcus aureus TaxID=1280 RepID=UPI001BFCE518|nr:hypothetical protein [Staphylococcus aureus]
MYHYRYDFKLYEQMAMLTWQGIVKLYRNLMYQTGDEVFITYENKIIAYEALSKLMCELDNFDEVFTENPLIDAKQYLLDVKGGLRRCIEHLDREGITKESAPLMHQDLKSMYEEIIMRLVAGRDYELEESDIL